MNKQSPCHYLGAGGTEKDSLQFHLVLLAERSLGTGVCHKDMMEFQSSFPALR